MPLNLLPWVNLASSPKARSSIVLRPNHIGPLIRRSAGFVGDLRVGLIGDGPNYTNSLKLSRIQLVEGGQAG